MMQYQHYTLGKLRDFIINVLLFMKIKFHEMIFIIQISRNIFMCELIFVFFFHTVVTSIRKIGLILYKKELQGVEKTKKISHLLERYLFYFLERLPLRTN